MGCDWQRELQKSRQEKSFEVLSFEVELIASYFVLKSYEIFNWKFPSARDIAGNNFGYLSAMVTTDNKNNLSFHLVVTETKKFGKGTSKQW